MGLLHDSDHVLLGEDAVALSADFDVEPGPLLPGDFVSRLHGEGAQCSVSLWDAGEPTVCRTVGRS